MKKLETRSGIKELRKEFGDRNVNNLVKSKLRQIVYEGNLKQNFTGNKLHSILNKEKNFEIFVEVLGREEANALLAASEELGEKAVTAQNIEELGKKLIKSSAGLKALKIFLDYI